MRHVACLPLAVVYNGGQATCKTDNFKPPFLCILTPPSTKKTKKRNLG